VLYTDWLGAKCMTSLSFKFQAQHSHWCVLLPTHSTVSGHWTPHPERDLSFANIADIWRRVYPYDGHVCDPAAMHTLQQVLDITADQTYLHVSVLIAVDTDINTRSLVCVANYGVDVCMYVFIYLYILNLNLKCIYIFILVFIPRTNHSKVVVFVILKYKVAIFLIFVCVIIICTCTECSGALSPTWTPYGGWISDYTWTLCPCRPDSCLYRAHPRASKYCL
jgi:hypothetical protein